MEQKKRTWIAMLVSVILVVAVFGSFGRSLFSTQTPSVILPSLQPDSSETSPSASSSDHAPRLEVTVDTVQAVISSLNRVNSCYRQLTILTAWSDNSSTTTVQTWTDGGYTYIRSTLPNGQIRCAIDTQDTLYYWYDDSTTWLTAPEGSLSADLFQHIPTYEDVLALPVGDIVSADYISFEGQPCIYVETRVDELGYLERYWISVDNGLLIAAETLKDEDVVYSMRSSNLQTPCPSNMFFALPDGTVLHSF